MVTLVSCFGNYIRNGTIAYKNNINKYVRLEIYVTGRLAL
jgi:hypothetical protein